MMKYEMLGYLFAGAVFGIAAWNLFFKKKTKKNITPGKDTKREITDRK